MTRNEFQLLLAARLSALLLSSSLPGYGREPLDVRPRPVVEVEEVVYDYTPANNGAGPMWCHGSTCLVRTAGYVFAAGLETLPDVPPLNNCRWTLYKRGPMGWELQQSDPSGRTREPSPLAALDSGRLLMSVNPTLVSDPEAGGGGRARPEILQFSASRPKDPATTLLPQWRGSPRFSEHSYRSLATDAARGELILFQNVDYTHAEWSFCSREGEWTANGRLEWPYETDYDTPQPVRICYPNVALKDHAVYFCGVSDIQEPYLEWRAFKKRLTGRDWDYDFRRLFFTWSDDIETGKFHDWIEIASRDKTCGWISPCDMWVGQDQRVHLLWLERVTDTRLRDEFFPGIKQSQALRYAIVEKGTTVLRRTLVIGGEAGPSVIPGRGRFQITPDRRLFVLYYAGGTNANGDAISENRILEVFENGTSSESVTVPLHRPFTEFFTATVRAGSPPVDVVELLGICSKVENSICYARIRLR